jgi:UDP-glucuronate 4-epimerase
VSERALVTGAAGFIGSHVVDTLLERGWSVTGLDNFDSFYDPAVKRANLDAASRHERFRLIEGDVRDLALMRRAVEESEPDVVIHLAARAGVRPSIEQPTLYAEVNVGGTAAVLEAAIRGGVRRLVVASSSSVYGDSATAPFKESDPALQPVSPYAATKRAAELICECWAALAPRARIISLRFFTVYGPRQRPDLAIHKFTRLLLADRPIPFFGDGESSRDYTYITDILDGVLGAVSRTADGGGGHEIFNLGESATTSLSELVRLLEEATEKRAVLERLPAQQGDVRRTFADISLARAALGYAPSIPVREGIPRFVKWYKEQAGRHATSAAAR